MWEFEPEELEHILKIIMKLKDQEDRNMIISLVEKASIGAGFRQGVEEVMKFHHKIIEADK